MSYKQPQTFFTDQDRAMSNAAEGIFPKSCHRLCQWHISKKVPSYLGALNSNFNFNKLFHKCMSGCQTLGEFESTWANMISSHNIEEHNWLNSLYHIRHKWSSAFSKDTFHCDIKSTSRSKSTNHVLNGLGSRTTSLFYFVEGFEKMVEHWRAQERQDDFSCSSGLPSRIIKESSILKHATTTYTSEI